MFCVVCMTNDHDHVDVQVPLSNDAYFVHVCLYEYFPGDMSVEEVVSVLLHVEYDRVALNRHEHRVYVNLCDDDQQYVASIANDVVVVVMVTIIVAMANCINLVMLKDDTNVFCVIDAHGVGHLVSSVNEEVTACRHVVSISSVIAISRVLMFDRVELPMCMYVELADDKVDDTIDDHERHQFWLDFE